MKIYSKALSFALSLTIGVSIFGMEEQPAKLSAFSKELKQRVMENEKNYKDQPFFSLNIMQPTPGYKTLKECVNFLFKNNKFDENYKPIPSKFFHMSLVTLAVPTDKVTATKVKAAMKDLKEITADVLPLLDLVSYSFRDLKGIGTNKFIAAHYGFNAGKQFFNAAYELIVARFLAKYPTTWMRYGYDPLPHVSVAVRKKPAEGTKIGTKKGAGAGSALHIPKLKIDTSQCRKIADLNLLHKGRDLEVSGQYFDTEAQKLETIKTTV